MYDTLGNYGFGFITDVKNVPISIRSVGIEKRSDSSYYLNNSHRDDCYLFQYTLSGTGTVVINGEKRIISEGQGFFLKMPADEEYYFDEETNSAPWHFIYITFYGDGCKGYYEIIKEKVGSFITLGENSSSINALSEIHRLARNGLIKNSFHCERLAFSFLCKLCSDCLSEQSSYSDLVVEAIEIIDREYATIGGILEVANRLGVSQSHLSRVFSEETKTSPIDYLTKARLQASVNLLIGTRETVEAISKKCGFSNGNYFCKVFRKHLGVSPSIYRSSASEYDRIII